MKRSGQTKKGGRRFGAAEMEHVIEGSVPSSVIDARNYFLFIVQRHAKYVLDALADDPYKKFLGAKLYFKPGGMQRTMSDRIRERVLWEQYQRPAWQEIESTVDGKFPEVSRTEEEEAWLRLVKPSPRPQLIKDFLADNTRVIAVFRKSLITWSREHNLDEIWCREQAYETLSMWQASPLLFDERMWHDEPIGYPIIASRGGRPKFVFSYDTIYPVEGLRSEIKRRILDKCEIELEAFLDERERQAEEGGLVRTPEKRKLEHFIWLVEHQINGLTYREIVEKYQDENGMDIRKISEAITSTASLIGLTLRSAQGRNRKLSSIPDHKTFD